jgi:GPH family glycoside/pentoside/hexuronide:cation symporter
MSIQALNQRLPMRQKVGYGLGSFLDMWGHWLYAGLVWQVFNMDLGVAPGLIATVMLVKTVVDAMSDAVFGWASDNTRTRWGRRRPYILVGGLLAGAALPLLFAVGRGWTEQQYFIFMLASVLLYVPLMSCFNMPWVSLGTEMTPDYHERTTVMSVKNAIQKLPEVAMFAAPMFVTWSIFNGPDGKPDAVRGAQVYTSILGLVMMACAVAIFTQVKERYYERVVVTQSFKVPFAETLYRTLRNRPFRLLLSGMLVYGLATAMVGTLGYYTTVYYVCRGDLAQGATWNTWMGVSSMVMGLVGIPFAGALARRWGKRNALATVLGLAALAFVGDWWFYNPDLPALQLLASGCVAFTGAGFWTLYGSALADVIDHDELACGQRREGAFAACQSWTSKAGMALGSFASGWILQFTGFDAKLEGLQSPETLTMIRLLLSGVPAIGLVIAMLVVLRFPLTEIGMLAIRRDLEARRGTV